MAHTATLCLSEFVTTVAEHVPSPGSLLTVHELAGTLRTAARDMAVGLALRDKPQVRAAIGSTAAGIGCFLAALVAAAAITAVRRSRRRRLLAAVRAPPPQWVAISRKRA